MLRYITVAVSAILLVFGAVFSAQVFEKIDADEIMVVQSPVKGTLTWHMTPGVKWQGMGKVTVYKKRSIYRFDAIDEKDTTHQKCSDGITIRFNDGGHGTLCGSIQYDLPLDAVKMTSLHTKFGSQEAVQKQLVETITGKAVYLSGPLMSSRESYAEKRNDLIHFVEDQIENGVYRTRQKETRVKDPITNQEKAAMVVEVVVGADGKPQRQEEGVLTSFGIRSFNFVIKRLPYDPTVEEQIRQQQKIAMDVQTAIADARKAEQRTITVAEQGKADAMVAKWKQEEIKAKFVTEAEQKKAVAQLDSEAAEFYRIAQLRRAEGDATYRAKVMAADGALQIKLDAWLKAQEMYATAIKEYGGQWVPTVQMGSNGATAGGAATDLINLLTAKTARELGLDMGMGRARQKGESETPAAKSKAAK